MNGNRPTKKKNNNLTDKEWKQAAQYAVRQYFSEEHKDKPWYREGVTEESVLLELKKPSGPISISSLGELWKDKTSLQKSFEKSKQSFEPQFVEDYLNRDREVANKPSYENWENTIKSMRSSFGDITRAMIGKISDNGMEKVRLLLNNIDVNEMSAEQEIILMEKIEVGRVEAAKWYAATLWDYAGKVSRFLKLLKKMKILSRTEYELVTEDEFQLLSLLAYLKPKEIQVFLLDDIDDDNNILKTFQNTVSRRVFSRIKLEEEVEEDLA